MALFLVTSRQTVYEQTKVEAENEQEALELAFVNCSAVDWDIIDATDFECFNAIKLKEVQHV
jgi:hypothetical protein